MLQRANQTKWTAIIAILAVLLLFVAPVVSKSMMVHASINGQMAPSAALSAHAMMGHHGMANSSEDMSAAGHQMPDSDNVMPAADHQMHGKVAAANGVPAHHAVGAAADTSSAMNDMACGYCDLLVHVPFLLWLFVSALLFLIFSSHVPVRVQEEKPWIKPPVRSHCPRAPPFCRFTFS